MSRITDVRRCIEHRLKIIITGVGVLSVSILALAFIQYANAQNSKIQQLDSRSTQTEQRLRQTQTQLFDTTKQLDATKNELQQKNQENDQLKQDNDKLKTDLQAKAKAQEAERARLAAVAHYSSGGRGGNGSSMGAIPRGSSAGNTYDYGYCTWYVKNRRPDLPNNLGNANTWLSRARAQGLPTGSQPRVGAVGATSKGELGHVVYVERVNGDGTIQIAEMNYEGFGIESRRTASASEFGYIY